MWKNIKINEEAFFFELQMTNDNNELKYILSDFKEIFFEKCSKQDILIRAKELNKRIEFDDKTVLDAIGNTPKEAVVCRDIANSNFHKILEVKYYISERPFKFVWKMHLASVDEFKNLITLPMMMCISSLIQETRELKEIIHKKDTEIEQYKLDGAELRRTTVATEKFDVENFEHRFSNIIPIANSIVNIINKNDELKKMAEGLVLDQEVNKRSSLISERHEKLRKSPKSKKRKIYEAERNMLLSRAKAEERKLKYDDSDSSGPSRQHENLKVETTILEIRKNLRELKDQSNRDFCEKELSKFE